MRFKKLGSASYIPIPEPSSDPRYSLNHTEKPISEKAELDKDPGVAPSTPGSPSTSKSHIQRGCVVLIQPSGSNLVGTDPFSPNTVTARSLPLVYPALLSSISEDFRQRINLSHRDKHGDLYPAAFDGQEAVDLLAYIIKTSDRNLALLLGRALGAQNLFHGVAYDCLLYDDSLEVYQLANPPKGPQWDEPASSFIQLGPDARGCYGAGVADTGIHGATDSENMLPIGVFTPLSRCYSPTCSKDQMCYSSRCPRQLYQLGAKWSEEGLFDHGLKEPGQLRVRSVSRDVAYSVSDQEWKHQQAIYNLISTERRFARDLQYLQEHWVEPLRTGDTIPPERRATFLHQVFWNTKDMLDVSSRLCDLLIKRQLAYPTVEAIGNIFAGMAPHFGHLVGYATHEAWSRYELEKEESSNPTFSSFMEAVERLPESRRTELTAYLAKPATRLKKYPELLEVVIKHTPDDHIDRCALLEAVKMFQDLLVRVDEERGKDDKKLTLFQLDGSLVFKPGKEVDLKLKDENRQLVYKGLLGRRRKQRGIFNGDLQVFLLDHVLLMARGKAVGRRPQLKVHRWPIPLELLAISIPISPPPRPYVGLSRTHSASSVANDPPYPNARTEIDSPRNGYQLRVSYLGKEGFSCVLWAPTLTARKEWMDNITAQQEIIRKRSIVFDPYVLNKGIFVGYATVNCATPYGNGQRIAYGTNDGVYIQLLHSGQSEVPVKKIDLMDVEHIDILEDYNLMLVLSAVSYPSERSVLTFPLDALDSGSPMKRMKWIASCTTFFKVGRCLNRTLVCIVRPYKSFSTIKIFEPIDLSTREKNRTTLQKLLGVGNDTLKAFKEFYLPTECHDIHFLKTKLCLGCTSSFEIVDLETLDTQALLDPADVSLNFIRLRQDVRPLNLYRIQRVFLLCYTEFAFYVDMSGQRSKNDFIIHWKGTPIAFVFHHPYILAFDRTFIEIWHVELGTLTQVIQLGNLRLLFTDIQFSAQNLVSSSASGRVSQTGSPNQCNLPASYAHTHEVRQNWGNGRDQVILASDNTVMELRLAPLPSSHIPPTNKA